MAEDSAWFDKYIAGVNSLNSVRNRRRNTIVSKQSKVFPQGPVVELKDVPGVFNDLYQAVIGFPGWYRFAGLGHRFNEGGSRNMLAANTMASAGGCSSFFRIYTG